MKELKLFIKGINKGIVKEVNNDYKDLLEVLMQEIIKGKHEIEDTIIVIDNKTIIEFIKGSD